MPEAPFELEVITLMPQLWPGLLGPHSGLTGQACVRGLARLRIGDLRAFGDGPHRRVDDSPYGGGAGMLLQVGPLHRAIDAARARTQGPVVLLCPGGATLDQRRVEALAAGPGMILVCGRYEGVDARVHRYVDQILSLGPFVLSAGDPAAFALADAVLRLRPGVLGNPASLAQESFGPSGATEYPQYTRPPDYDGQSVPQVLRQGDHRAIARFRAQHCQPGAEVIAGAVKRSQHGDS